MKARSDGRVQAETKQRQSRAKEVTSDQKGNPGVNSVKHAGRGPRGSTTGQQIANRSKKDNNRNKEPSRGITAAQQTIHKQD